MMTGGRSEDPRPALLGARRGAVLAAVLTLPCVGCYTTWDIAPRELGKLDGYRAPAPTVIFDTKDEKVVVDEGLELGFTARDPAPGAPPLAPYARQELVVKFDAIDVHVAPNEWWLSGILHGDKRWIRVDLNQVKKVVAQRYSHGKTAGLVIGCVAGTAAIFVGITLGLVASWASHAG
jgi:hypothetical protein